jgi:hypothetical protein
VLPVRVTTTAEKAKKYTDKLLPAIHIPVLSGGRSTIFCFLVVGFK